MSLNVIGDYCSTYKSDGWQRKCDGYICLHPWYPGLWSDRFNVLLSMEYEPKWSLNIACEIIFIRWTFNFMFFVGRAIHEFKIPLKYFFTLFAWHIIWNPQTQVSTIVIKPRNCVPIKMKDFTVNKFTFPSSQTVGGLWMWSCIIVDTGWNCIQLQARLRLALVDLSCWITGLSGWNCYQHWHTDILPPQLDSV